MEQYCEQCANVFSLVNDTQLQREIGLCPLKFCVPLGQPPQQARLVAPIFPAIVLRMLQLDVAHHNPNTAIFQFHIRLGFRASCSEVIGKADKENVIE